jgi:hypothetical protein
MLLRYKVLFAGMLLCISVFANAQSTDAPASDATARAILTQSLAASGAANVQSFTASGTTTYFWGGEEIQAVTTVRAKGHDQFRLDSSVPGGMRSIALTKSGGERKNPDDSITEMPAHNRLNAGFTTFPYPGIAAALSE